MAGDIRERFLADAKHPDGHIGGELHIRNGRLKGSVDTGPFLELLALPLNGGDQAQVIEDAWPQVSGDPAYGLDRLVEQANRAAQLLPRLLCSRTVESFGDPEQIH